VLSFAAAPIYKWLTEAVVLLPLNPAEPSKIPPPSWSVASIALPRLREPSSMRRIFVQPISPIAFSPLDQSYPTQYPAGKIVE
jgi:hypothetical protein